jgi:ArsR family metal-binding transcriptional regulator
MGEINDARENREQLIPSYERAPKPRILEILNLLPKTNCRECGERTCMALAARIAEAAKGLEGCPQLEEGKRMPLEKYMEPFQFDV